MHGVDDVGFYDGNIALGDVYRVIDAEIPEIGVEAVISWRQDRRLRPTLAAMSQEIFGVEHVQLVSRGEKASARN